MYQKSHRPLSLYSSCAPIAHELIKLIELIEFIELIELMSSAAGCLHVGPDVPGAGPHTHRASL